jgi:hypothetical protein
MYKYKERSGGCQDSTGLLSLVDYERDDSEKADRMRQCSLVVSLCVLGWLSCFSLVSAASPDLVARLCAVTQYDQRCQDAIDRLLQPPDRTEKHMEFFDRLASICHATQYDARCVEAMERFSTSLDPGRVVSVRLSGPCEGIESGTVTMDGTGRFTDFQLCIMPSGAAASD